MLHSLQMPLKSRECDLSHCMEPGLGDISPRFWNRDPASVTMLRRLWSELGADITIEVN